MNAVANRITTSCMPLLAAFSVGACDPAPSAEPPIGGKADSIAEATLVFDADFGESVSGILRAGDTAAVEFDPDRLPECRGRQGGRDAWAITGFTVVDGQKDQSFAVTELHDGVAVPVAATFEVPRAGHVELYFEVVDVFGCRAIDSDFGANYRFEIDPAETVDAASIAFSTASPDPVVKGDLGSERLIVSYQPARLDLCASTRNGLPQWNLTGFYQVDGGEPRSFAAARIENGSLVAADTTLELPPGDELSLWFEATGATGCHQRDPEVGGYRFSRGDSTTPRSAR